MAVKLSTIFKMELSLFSAYYTHPEIQVCRTDPKELEGEKKCLSPAKKYKLYKSSINKSIHFAQRSLSSSTRGQRVIAQLNLSRE